MKFDLILASASPRRKEILDRSGIKFTSVDSEFDERSIKISNPEKLVKMLAEEKTKSVAKKLWPSDKVFLGADTVVVMGNKIIGKPKNLKDAKETLENLSGKTHKVITGFCILQNTTNLKIIDCAETTVFMKTLSPEIIDWYLSTNEALGKAGSYAIQGFGRVLIEKIDGDFYNVVGLPISKIWDHLIGLN